LVKAEILTPEMQNPQCIHILVADDNVINQTLFAKMLSVLGVQADVVDSGSRALEACQSQHYDMIFMDYQMPGTDGVEAAKSIKEINPVRKPVIILITANLLVNDYYLSHPGIVDDFLKKPFTLQEMADIIEKWQPLFAVHYPSNDK
jgi:CheY-like chemotaxis protein